MNRSQKGALAEYLISLGDDELILAHRDSEWAGHAPILEEDIAFANIALDEMGHAAAWYRLAGELLDQSVENYPDDFFLPESQTSSAISKWWNYPMGNGRSA